MLDLLIRGGTVVDGSGEARFTADVGVAGGRVVEVGRITGQARQTIDADGLIVSPGFIDGHTHLDAQIMWDPYSTSSCYHGVTTVVMSNCGFTLAPCKPEDRQWYANCLSYVEDIPGEAMAAGMEWSWETYPEYMAAIERQPKALNHAMYLGHSALRMYVMGRRALAEEATEDEVRAMAALAQEALRVGALGLSTSLTHTHMTPEGTPVASRNASWGEIEQIFAAMAGLGGGIFQTGAELTSQTRNLKFLEWMRHLALTYRRPVMFGIVNSRQGDDPVKWNTQADVINEVNAAGGTMYAQGTTRSINAIFSLKSYLPFDVLPEWKAFRSKPVEEQLAYMRDPANRGPLIAAEQNMRPPDNKLQGGGAATTDPRKPDYTRLFALRGVDWDEPSIAELSQARGTHPVETMIELMLENPDQVFVWPVVNENPEDVLGMLSNEHILATFSDSGAHAAQEMGSSLQTHFLNYWVDKRKQFTLEQAVRKMSHDIARAFGFRERGLVKEGYKADLLVFEEGGVRPHLPKIEHDLPGGARRLVQKAEGIHNMIVNGAITMEGGTPTGAHAGEVIKGELAG